MVHALSFTVKDICHALGDVSRSRVHAWTQLPPFSLIETSERSARRFDVTDMITLAALLKLEDVYGIKSRHLGHFSEGIHRYLAQPKSIDTNELVFVGLKLNTVSGAGTETRELLEKRIHLLSPARLLPAKAGVEVKRYQGTR